jgi:hypothetical protein
MGIMKLLNVIVSGVKMQPKLKARSPLSQELRSTESAVQEFMRLVGKNVSASGVKLISVGTRDWASQEDSSWEQLVIDVVVESDPKDALSLWDKLNDELDKFIERQDKTMASQLRESFSVAVHWKL